MRDVGFKGPQCQILKIISITIWLGRVVFIHTLTIEEGREGKERGGRGEEEEGISR